MTHLTWTGCRNTRDLGGLPTRYGVRTRAGALIRTESLHHLDPAGRAALDEVDAGLVLDLRSAGELAGSHPAAGSTAYRNIPWIDPDEAKTPLPTGDQSVLYQRSLGRDRAQVGLLLRAIAEAPADRPVIVHCAGGKDRTGILVALLLELVGVPRDVIAADYAESEVRLGLQEADASRRTLPATMLELLAFVDSEYGGVRAYFAWCGLSAAEVGRLAGRLGVREA